MPSSKVLHERLSGMLGFDRLSSRECWSLLALLRVFAKLDQYIIPILSEHSETEREIDNSDSKNGGFTKSMPIKSSELIKFLYQLAFVNIEDLAEECVLPIRLKFAAQKLIVKIAKSLTPNRFRKTSTQLSWDVGNSAYDAIAFKVDSPANQQYSYELELLVKNGDSLNERWILAEKASGSVSDRMEVLEHQQTSNAECSPQIVMIRFSNAKNLRSDSSYAVRLLLNGSKTFYGEDGICSLRLQNNVQLNFMPCSLSENGTTILRGQIPCLLYSVDKVSCTNNGGISAFQQDAATEFATAIDNKKNAVGNYTSCNPNDHLFVLMLRLLAQKLSMKSVSGKLSQADRRVCSQVVGYANVFVELNPRMAFDVIAAFDEALPLISNANDEQDEDEEEEQQKCQKQRHAKKDKSLQKLSPSKK
uniref:PHR domain-containing protein n=1 Tax=Ditylenchus dipsaci TaxID=166011 RepID=A0A915DEE6_9BILA